MDEQHWKEQYFKIQPLYERLRTVCGEIRHAHKRGILSFQDHKLWERFYEAAETGPWDPE